MPYTIAVLDYALMGCDCVVNAVLHSQPDAEKTHLSYNFPGSKTAVTFRAVNTSLSVSTAISIDINMYVQKT